MIGSEPLSGSLVRFWLLPGEGWELEGHTTPEQGTRIFESPRVLSNNGHPYPGHRPCIQQDARTSQGTIEIINLDLGSASNGVLRPQRRVHEVTLPLTGRHRFHQEIITVF